MKVLYLCFLVLLAGLGAKAQSTQIDTVFKAAELDREADFEGGMRGWTMYLIRNLTYPPDAMRKGETGTVVVQFVVDENGKPSDIIAIAGPESLQKEGIRLIKKSPRWVPAMKNGEKVKSYKQQQIIFKLSN